MIDSRLPTPISVCACPSNSPTPFSRLDDREFRLLKWLTRRKCPLLLKRHRVDIAVGRQIGFSWRLDRPEAGDALALHDLNGICL